MTLLISLYHSALETGTGCTLGQQKGHSIIAFDDFITFTRDSRIRDRASKEPHSKVRL
jgi:hypothetical protein